MNVASQSNVVCYYMENQGFDFGSFMVNVIVGIFTGIISSYIITKWYRNKDEEKESVRFICELYKFSFDVVMLSMPLKLLRDEDIDNAHEMVKKMDIPVWYKWLKFNDTDGKIVDSAFKKSKDMWLWLIDLKIKRDFSRSDGFVESDRKKYATEFNELNDKIAKGFIELSSELKELKNILERYRN